LRAALNEAVRVGLIPANPAVGVELPSVPYPRPTRWNAERVAAWRQDGTCPTVPVWTPAQTAAFLAFVREHRLYALFHLVERRSLVLVSLGGSLVVRSSFSSQDCDVVAEEASGRVSSGGS
jgi:hypothetical protein